MWVKAEIFTFVRVHKPYLDLFPLLLYKKWGKTKLQWTVGNIQGSNIAKDPQVHPGKFKEMKGLSCGGDETPRTVFFKNAKNKSILKCLKIVKR